MYSSPDKSITLGKSRCKRMNEIRCCKYKVLGQLFSICHNRRCLSINLYRLFTTKKAQEQKKNQIVFFSRSFIAHNVLALYRLRWLKSGWQRRVAASTAAPQKCRNEKRKKSTYIRIQFNNHNVGNADT